MQKKMNNAINLYGLAGVHPAANLFPLMSPEEFEKLKEDGKKQGWLHPVKVDKNRMLIDGRNRLLASVEIEKDIEIEEADFIDPIAYVLSENVYRRHLTTGQKAIIALDLEKMYAEEAKENKTVSLRKNEENLTIVPNSAQSLSEAEVNKSRDKAGKALNVGHTAVSTAKKIVKESPELAEKVKNREMSLNKAKNELKKNQRKKAKENYLLEIEKKVKTTKAIDINNTSKKYRVVYADPPWSYNDKCNSGSIQDGGVEVRHYDTMTIKELCELPIKNILGDNAVLFLWVTSPLLEACFDVIREWGFKYKTSFVWDKIAHNMGHYNSVRHEFLLVCTKGSCTPDKKKLYDSVISIEKTKHSKKPSEVIGIIDDLYEYGNRIELFARANNSKQWDVWGNEV